MALTCPFCRTENPDGTQFCEACGHSLSDGGAGNVPPPPAPWTGQYTGPAAPGGAPPYGAAPPATPARRRSRAGLIAGIAGAVVVILVIGVVGGVLLVRSRQPLIPNGKAVSTKTFSVTVPKSWTVDERKSDLVDFFAGNGSFFVSSDGKFKSSDTAASILRSIRQDDEQQYGTTTICRSAQSMSVQGKQGEMEGFKYTVQFNDGSSEVHCSMVWVGVSRGNYYEVAFTSTTALIAKFYSNAEQKVIPGLVWKR